MLLLAFIFIKPFSRKKIWFQNNQKLILWNLNFLKFILIFLPSTSMILWCNRYFTYIILYTYKNYKNHVIRESIKFIGIPPTKISSHDGAKCIYFTMLISIRRKEVIFEFMWTPFLNEILASCLILNLPIYTV